MNRNRRPTYVKLLLGCLLALASAFGGAPRTAAPHSSALALASHQ